MAEIFIKTPPERVFDYLADFPRHSEWAGHRLNIQQTSTGPVGAGTTYKSVGHQFGQDNEDRIEVTEFVPGSKLTFEADGKGARMRHTMTLRPGDGGTHLSKDARPLRLATMTKLLLPLLLILGPRLLKKDLENIRARIEEAN